MTLGSPPRDAAVGRLVGGTVLGTSLVAAGLVMAYLTVATPLVADLVPARSVSATIGVGVWSFALIAGGGLLVAGTSRLAAMLAAVRRPRQVGGPAARTLGLGSEDTVVATDVVPGEGRPIPELVIGAFGMAVVHALPSPNQARRSPFGWEVRGRNGWLPMEDPRERAARDADRVRRWVALADLDFVVRVYAAVVVDGMGLERWPACAVITEQQIQAWLNSLPRQRTLTAGRRGRLLAMASPQAVVQPSPGRRGW